MINKIMFKKAFIIFVVIVPILCMGDYVPGDGLVRFKRGVVELPPGKMEGDISSIKGNSDLRV
jgi:hypothetical protein